MPQNADNVMIAGDGNLFVAPTGTPLPTNIATALNAAFINTGFLSEDGATFRDEKTKEPVNVWQSFYAVKYRVTESNAEMEMVLKQWDKNTVPLAFGGGAVTTTAGPPAYYTYTPPSPDVIDERAAVLEWRYATKTFRLVVPKVMVTSGAESQLARASESDLPLTLGILGTTGVSPWLLYTDHAAFA
jgi:hypothetical protein